jgi:hypothetical protein
VTSDFVRNYNAGLKQARQWYLTAIACQIRGDADDAEEAWDSFEAAIADMLTLAYLSGETATYAAAKKSGMAIKPQEFPKTRPDTFAATAVGLEPGPFWRAIRRFRSRLPMGWTSVEQRRLQARRLAEMIAKEERSEALDKLKKQMADLNDVLRGTFRVKGATAAQAKRIKRLLADSIEKQHLASGLRRGGLAKFIKRAQVENIVGVTSARLETVYRTNLSAAYNDAAYDIAKKPEVQKWAPLLRLVEVHDSRTRGAPGGQYKGNKSRNPGYHWQMNGYIETAERFKEQNLIPPNGFNCRGAIVSVTMDEAIRLKLASKDGILNKAALRKYNQQKQRLIEQGYYPDPGFKR